MLKFLKTFLKTIPPEKILPTVVIILFIGCAVGYIPKQNWRLVLYYLFAAGLNLVVTW